MPTKTENEKILDDVAASTEKAVDDAAHAVIASVAKTAIASAEKAVNDAKAALTTAKANLAKREQRLAKHMAQTPVDVDDVEQDKLDVASAIAIQEQAQKAYDAAMSRHSLETRNARFATVCAAITAITVGADDDTIIPSTLTLADISDAMAKADMLRRQANGWDYIGTRLLPLVPAWARQDADSAEQKLTLDAEKLHYKTTSRRVRAASTSADSNNGTVGKGGHRGFGRLVDGVVIPVANAADEARGRGVFKEGDNAKRTLLAAFPNEYQYIDPQ